MKSVYIETYGCQMNLSDTEIVQSILVESGYKLTNSLLSADIILLNTCSVRENAERKIFERLKALSKVEKNDKNILVGVIGCMAERLREKLTKKNKIVSVIVGPDEYRKLPDILQKAFDGFIGYAVNLSPLETYDDIIPLRQSKISAFVSIMRGCNNFCSYCVVPYTRGRERSRSSVSILTELKRLVNNGYKEITFLGQNVNSYYDKSALFDFPELLANCSAIANGVRLRFITSHPKDLSKRLIEVIASSNNICKHLHLPVQSGSDRILKLMNRGYNSKSYIELINQIRTIIPEISITTDIITGFPTETLEDHEDTLELIKKIKFDGAFMFRYSAREGTKAYQYADDVPENEKIRRLNEIISVQQIISKGKNENEIGKIYDVLVEGKSKRDTNDWKGRTDNNKIVIFDNIKGLEIKEGDIVNVKILSASSATLKGKIITHK